MAEEKAKRRTAAALRYDPEQDDVPVLSALGEGYLAERIIEAATEHGVPVLEDAGLAAMLAKLSTGDQIPPQLYEAVAKILVFVGEMDRSYSKTLAAASLNKGSRTSGSAGRGAGTR